MEKLRATLVEKGLPSDDEHCVIYAMFPQELEKLYKGGAGAPAAPVASSAPKPEIKAPAPAQPVIPGTTKKISRLALTIEGKRHDVSVEELA
jgi:oxaloacetate decarboxylase alpha subunit/pyruvate carboxylase subunit B